MRRARLLHVLASAPAAVVLTVAPALSAPAVGAASLPPPYVVCIDPGHGGVDPGAIGLDGLVEKNLTLDVSDRLAALLRADGVTVVMTRTTDASVSIQARSDIANAAHADVFLPIYFNAWATPTPDGSVVLYPYARDIPFAQAISQAVTTYISPYGDNDGGIVLRDNWWLQPTMPTATVESLFITNPHDAALLTRASFREGLAEALKNGIETFLPGILQRQREILAATPAAVGIGSVSSAPPSSSHSSPSHRGAVPASGHTRTATSTGAAATTGGTPAGLQVVEWLLLIVAVLLAIRHRRRLIGLAGSGLALAARYARSTGIHHRMLRRRRRLVRERAVSAGGGDGARAHPLCDELLPVSRRPLNRAEPTGPGLLPEELDLPTLEVRGRRVETTRHSSLDELPL
jgi:N-acetylmuramoyl-L-alanine amidase